MTNATAKILAQALTARREAEWALCLTMKYRSDAHYEEIDKEMKSLAEIYVHEQRIINRIVSEARDDE